MLKPAGFCRGSPGMGAFWFQLFETGSYSQKSDIHPIVRSTPPLTPPPIYPLFPILIPIADALPSAGKSAFCDQALVEVSYSQKSFLYAPSKPVPTYPLPPMLKPTAPDLTPPPKFAFLVQTNPEGSSS